MKKVTVVALILMVLLALSLSYAEKAPQRVYDLANSTLAPLGSDPIIVKAVKEANTTGQTLSEVQAMDNKWKNTAGIADYMRALMNSDCGKYLQKLQRQESYYAEIFVMDRLGANVAMTDKTSDYWQGDEAKFKNSYNNGRGAVFVDEVEFDDSTQAYLVQVSVPVKDGNRVIGAITFGIDIDAIE